MRHWLRGGAVILRMLVAVRASEYQQTHGWVFVLCVYLLTWFTWADCVGYASWSLYRYNKIQSCTSVKQTHTFVQVRTNLGVRALGQPFIWQFWSSFLRPHWITPIQDLDQRTSRYSRRLQTRRVLCASFQSLNLLAGCSFCIFGFVLAFSARWRLCCFKQSGIGGGGDQHGISTEHKFGRSLVYVYMSVCTCH